MISSPENALDIFSDELSILIYISKEDGRLNKKQKEIIADYIFTYLKSPKITITDIVKNLRYTKATRRSHFSETIERMKKLSAEDKNSLLKAVKNIIAAKETKDPLEEVYVTYTAQTWGCN